MTQAYDGGDGRMTRRPGFIDRIAERARHAGDPPTQHTAAVPSPEAAEESASTETRSFAATCWANAWTLVVAFVLLVLSRELRGTSEDVGVEHDTFYSHLTSEIAVALIVAYIIIISIEYRSRGELNKIIAKFLVHTHGNLFQAIMGVQFPVRVFDLVRDRLMREPAYRLSTEVHFTIKDIDLAAPKLYGIPTVAVTTHCSYVIKNLSDRTYLHPLRFFVEATDTAKENLPSLIIDGKALDRETIKAADEAWNDSPGMQRFEYNLTLLKDEERHVAFEHTQNKLIADTLTWRSLHPCDGLRVSVTHPRDLLVFTDSIHPDELEVIESNDYHKIGRIDRPLFPANGFMFWWVPREPNAAKGEPEPETPG